MVPVRRSGRPPLRPCHQQPEMPFQMVQIAVVVQEAMTGLDAVGADQHVDGLAHGDAEPAQEPVVRGRLRRDAGSPHRRAAAAAPRGRAPPGRAFVRAARPPRAEPQVAHDDEGGAVADHVTKMIDLGGRRIAQMVDPDRAVHDDHDRARPSRLASRSPTHSTWPASDRFAS